MNNSENQNRQCSTFVSVVAWLFIIFAGFGVLISLMQNIMVHTMFSMPEMQEAMNNSGAASEIPPFAIFMFNHFRLFVSLMLVMTLFTLISAIGLLKRKNWARKVFIRILCLSILIMFMSIVVQYFFFISPHDYPGEKIPAEFQTMRNFMQIFFVILYAGIVAILGWIIKKLLSPDISHEFQPQ